MSIKNCCPFSLIRIQTFAVTLAPGLGNHFTITVLSSSSPGSMLISLSLLLGPPKLTVLVPIVVGAPPPNEPKGGETG